jgi:protein-S-isoprenylcysteine O-methyltransferase Ste14
MLGTSFGIVAANRGVKVLGPYRFVRHPMYAGYTISNLSIFLVTPTLFIATIYLCTLAAQIARINAEERVLRKDVGYRAFTARVHFRLLPGVF